MNWDGISHWSEFLIFSPKFMGPNAMPVPEVSKGRVNNEAYLRIGGQFQTRSGDRTGNITLRGGYNFLKDRIALDVFMVPIEVYSLSTRRKLERNVYFENWSKKTAVGDLYINTNFQVLNEEKHRVDLMVRIGLKTASSGLDNAARFIDSPGYYFDGSLGKVFEGSSLTIRPYGMMGFFAWQTNDESLRQNDAVLYGIGLDMNHKNWHISPTLRGYSGYHDIGDKPLIFKTTFAREIGSSRLQLDYQYGIRDYLYQSIELSLQYSFQKE